MWVLKISVLLSSSAFIVYVVDYFRSPQMKNEFKRFGMEKLGLLIVLLQLLGAIGLLVGLFYDAILVIASLGLALLMLAGLIVRIISKDSLRSCMPALFFLCLNAYIGWATLVLRPSIGDPRLHTEPPSRNGTVIGSPTDGSSAARPAGAGAPAYPAGSSLRAPALNA